MRVRSKFKMLKTRSCYVVSFWSNDIFSELVYFADIIERRRRAENLPKCSAGNLLQQCNCANSVNFAPIGQKFWLRRYLRKMYIVYFMTRAPKIALSHDIKLILSIVHKIVHYCALAISHKVFGPIQCYGCLVSVEWPTY